MPASCVSLDTSCSYLLNSSNTEALTQSTLGPSVSHPEMASPKITTEQVSLAIRTSLCFTVDFVFDGANGLGPIQREEQAGQVQRDCAIGRPPSDVVGGLLGGK
jgi:hypothetical protein